MIRSILAVLILFLFVIGCSDTELPDEYYDVEFETEDGFTIRGTLYLTSEMMDSTAEDVYPAVILAHMFQNNRKSWDRFARKLVSEGYAALAIDFRAWGKSEGVKADILHHYRDIIAAKNYLTSLRIINRDKIIAVGASMGGMAAIEAAALDSTIAGVVALSTPHEWMGSVPVNVADQISPRPLLIIAASNDPHLTIRAAEQNYIRAREPKEWKVIDIARHGTDIFSTDKAEELESIILEFLDRHFKTNK